MIRMLVLLALVGILAVVSLLKNLSWPVPQKPGLKPYIAKYLVHPRAEPERTNGDYTLMIYSDGAGHIVSKAGDEGWSITDYNRRATYAVSKARGIYTHAEMINPNFPSPFTGSAIFDEQCCQIVGCFQGKEQVGKYNCHKYGRFKLPGHNEHDEDDLGTYWYCPEVNVCAKSEIGPGLNGYARSTLIEFNSEAPSKNYFDLSPYREVPCSEFYRH